jgi:hypothetical protein
MRITEMSKSEHKNEGKSWMNGQRWAERFFLVFEKSYFSTMFTKTMGHIWGLFVIEND